MTTASSPSSSSSWRSSRSRAYSSCARTRSASGASRSSWRAVKLSLIVSSQMPLAWHSGLDLVRLLEGRAVDPVDQRLRRAADRAEVDRVEAPLIGVRALRVAAVELGRRDGQCGHERLPQRRAATLQRPATAVDARVRPADLAPQHALQVL